MWGLHIRFGFKELAPSLELDLMGFEDPQYLHVHVYGYGSKLRTWGTTGLSLFSVLTIQ